MNPASGKHLLRRALSTIAVATLVAYFLHLASRPVDPRLVDVALALIPIYLLGHLLRAVRLFLLLHDGRIRFADVAMAHITAAGVSGLIPFKVGEVYRLAAIDRLVASPSRAVLTVWIERIYDMLMVSLALVALLLVAGSSAWAPYGWFFGGGVLFVFVSFFLFLVLPENLNLVKRYLILRHNSERTLTALAWIDRVHGLLRSAAGRWRHRWATLVWLSVGIWACEFTVLFAAIGLFRTGAGAGAAEVGLRIFHAITLRSSAWSDADAIVAGVAGGGIDDRGIVTAYHIATVDALAALTGLLLVSHLVVKSWRRADRQARPRPSPHLPPAVGGATA